MYTCRGPARVGTLYYDVIVLDIILCFGAQELLPIVVTFNLPMPGRVDSNSYEIQQIMLTYNVNIHIKPVREC